MSEFYREFPKFDKKILKLSWKVYLPESCYFFPLETGKIRLMFLESVENKKSGVQALGSLDILQHRPSTSSSGPNSADALEDAATSLLVLLLLLLRLQRRLLLLVIWCRSWCWSWRYGLADPIQGFLQARPNWQHQQAQVAADATQCTFRQTWPDCPYITYGTHKCMATILSPHYRDCSRKLLQPCALGRRVIGEPKGWRNSTWSL